MKIESEVHNSLYSFADVKCGGGGGGSRRGARGCALDLSPTAQERSSIDRPERQLGCGSNALPADDQNNGIVPSAFDCEHFQFIDDDDDTDDGNDETAKGDEEGRRGECGTLPPPRTQEVSQPPVVVAAAAAPKDKPTCPGTDRDVAVDQVCPRTDPAVDARVQADAMSESSKAVKRQVSFDDAVVVAAGEPSSTTKKELKSLLKKGSRPHKRRVTFNEAVSLYSDEHEGVRHLQLTTGPDIICESAFYMFEPPIEYQDLPPFEPPAEYRDDDTPTPPSEPATEEPSTAEQKCGTDDSVVNDVVVEENLNGQQPVLQQQKEVEVSPVVLKQETNSTPKEIKTVETKSNQVQIESAKESDKLFERFLEAEREFAVDEELNNVFHELDSDFANDGVNGALDDNFFRKLITLLSSAEGDAPLEDSDFLSSTKFASTTDDLCQDAEDDDNSQTHSRTLSEADSDCSISSQDTIIVRLGEDENEHNSNIVNNAPCDCPKDVHFEEKISPEKEDIIMLEKQEIFDEVFNNDEGTPRPLPRESLVMKNMQMHQAAVKMDKTNEESLSRQSSGEQSVNSGTSSQDPPQDADDSTSSDSRSGEVEEEIRLDDIGYDEEDADDYDEESFRGMARGNSKIRRIIKKNALQCSLFKGIEAKRRQQPGAKYPRPKSPLLSQESLVEKLKWLTTVDDQKDTDPLNFHSKPPDVILSTGEIPMNGSIPSSEDDIHNRTAMAYQQQQQFYQMQRFAMPPNSKGGYYVRQDGYHASLPRQRMSCPGHPSQMSTHNMAYAPARMAAHPGNQQQQWSEQRNMTVPRNFRDWRVIQRVMVSRNNSDGSRSPQVPADYVRCANGTFSPPNGPPPDVSRTSSARGAHKDELEQFVEQDSKRLDKLRKRYSLAEEAVDDPTFGFARRPSVRGVQSRMQANPSDSVSCHKLDYSIYEEGGQGQGQHLVQTRAAYATDQMRVWSRDPNWRAENSMVQYGPIGPGGVRPMHIHRASVALTELPGCATIPYAHRKPHPDPRYHSYAESMYGSTRTLPTKGWDPRSCHHNVSNPAAVGSQQSLQNSYQNSPSASHQIVGPPPQMLLVPPVAVNKGDERGVPEGASSSPKISSDSLYHAPVAVPDSSGGQRKDEGVIYYSLNV